MTVSEVNLHTTLISAYRFLKTRDEFGAAQLLGALLLLSKHFPLEIQVIPKQEWQQTADAYLDELLSQWLQRKAVDRADPPALPMLALDGFSFQRPLLGTPPATHWPTLIAELCELLAPVWSSSAPSSQDWGQTFLEVVMGRPRFVKAFTPTPSAAAQLAAGLLDVQPGQRVLNLQCRLGQILLLLSASAGPHLSLTGTGSDPQAVKLCALVLLLSEVPNAQVMSLPLSPDLPLLGLEPRAYDRVVAHPAVEAAVGKSVQFIEELVIEQVLGSLAKDGRAVIIVSSGYLYRKRPDPVLRRELVASGQLRAVIQLPGATRDPGGPATLLVLDQPQETNDILFLDLSEIGPSLWLQPQVAQGLIRAPQAFLEEGWSALFPGDAAAPQPGWRVVAQKDILSDADLSPARYLSAEVETRTTRSALSEAQSAYQEAQQHLRASTGAFDQVMDELFGR